MDMSLELENEKKWTKGVWQTHVEWNITGYPVYSIHGMSGAEKEDRPVLEANAQLIAAAPELYESLETLLGYVDSPCGGCGEFNVPPIFMAQAKAALAKARGEVTQ